MSATVTRLADAKPPQDQEATGTALIPLQDPDPRALFAPGGLDGLLLAIEAEAIALVPDTTTRKGRDAIASNAAKVAKCKTYLDGLGKDYVAALKVESNAVDAQRRAMRDRLDALKERVRAPLTEYEAAELARLAALHERIRAFSDLATQLDGLDSATLAQRIEIVRQVAIDATWEELTTEAAQRKDAALGALYQAFHDAEAQEIERAESERRQAEEAARLQAERDARIAAEATEAARRQAQAQAQQQALEAERARLALVAAQQAAERRALAAEQALGQARAEAAERAKTEPERQPAAEPAQAHERNHAAQIHREIAADLAGLGASWDMAQTIVRAIARGQIPHLAITY